MGLRREQAARTQSIAGCALGGLASLVGGLSGRLCGVFAAVQRFRFRQTDARTRCR
jgi:hypothetical protein